MLRSDRLLEAVSGYRHVVVVSHDNPDPDAISTGWAVQWLISQKLSKKVRLISGGAIVRAENRAMVRLLNPPLELVEDIPIRRDTAAVLVDCGTGAGNHLLRSGKLTPVAVIDHHQTSMRNPKVPFCDIRPKVAAAATIAASYLREQKMPPDELLATALLYGIRSETEGIAASHSRLDRSMISWLSHCANPTTLAAIENAPLTRGYFSDLVLALQNTFVYEDAAFCFLPRAEGSETVGEVADLLARAEGVNRVLCAAVNNGDIVVSVRTERNTDRASTLVREVVNGLGQAGGHEHRAGGRIHDFRRHGADTDDMQQHLRSAWLKACRVQKKRGKRLVALREIVKNL